MYKRQVSGPIVDFMDEYFEYTGPRFVVGPGTAVDLRGDVKIGRYKSSKISFFGNPSSAGQVAPAALQGGRCFFDDYEHCIETRQNRAKINELIDLLEKTGLLCPTVDGLVCTPVP